MSRHNVPIWPITVAVSLLAGVALWWLGREGPAPEPTDDAPMSEEEERVLMQEIGYLK